MINVRTPRGWLMGDDETSFQMAPEPERETVAVQSLDVPTDSPALRRLIDELRSEEIDVPRSYNRTFNRWSVRRAYRYRPPKGGEPVQPRLRLLLCLPHGRRGVAVPTEASLREFGGRDRRRTR